MTGDMSLRELEQHWQMNLPVSMLKLYHAFEYPFINPCEFIPVHELIEDIERWRGMLPRFMPFGHDSEENFFGFYTVSGSSAENYPVLAWNHEYDFYYPISSSFDAFLRWCILQGRYEAHDSFELGNREYTAEETRRREFAETLDLPIHLITGPLPRNMSELYEQQVNADPQATDALLQMGGLHLLRNDAERAKDCFTRATEAAPWFGDPYNLLGDTFAAQNRLPEAVVRYWQVVQSQIALSTRYSRYAVKNSEQDTEMYEAAVDALISNEDHLPVEMCDSPVYRLLLQGYPTAYKTDGRLALAKDLHVRGDTHGAERELLNALTLAVTGADMSVAYEHLIDYYMHNGCVRDADICRGDADRE